MPFSKSAASLDLGVGNILFHGICAVFAKIFCGFISDVIACWTTTLVKLTVYFNIMKKDRLEAWPPIIF
jgi:hypothetical protein